MPSLSDFNTEDPEDGSERRSGSLRSTPLVRAAASGVKWLSVGNAASAGSMLIQTIVLARLLTPSDFGSMAAAMILLTFAQAFADGGVSQAILRAQTSTRDVLSSLYWFNVFAGFAVAAIVIALAPAAATFFHNPEVSTLLRWTSLVFVLMPWGLQFQMLLQRELEFRVLAATQVAAAAIGTVVAITAAALGAGALSLAWGWTCTFGVQSAVYVSLGWRRWPPSLRFRRSDLHGYLQFGMYRIGDRLLNAATANMDYLMIGKFLGPTSLGLYSLAYQIIIRPLIYINPVLVDVAFPIFARRQKSSDALRYGFTNVIKIIGYIIFPLLIGLAVLAHAFVPILLGDRWEGIVPLLQVLWAVGVLRCLSNAALPIALSRGRADYGFYINLGATVTMAAVLYAASHMSLQAVTWGVLIVVTGQTVVWYFVLHREIALRLSEGAKALLRPLLAGAAGAGAALAIGALLEGMDSAQGLTFVGMLASGTAIYVTVAFLLDASYVRTMIGLLIHRPRAEAG